MAVTLTIAAGSYLYPEEGEENWGTIATDAMVAVCANALWGTGGEIDYLVTSAANPAQSGKIRFANSDDGLAWRNTLNTADLLLDVASNRLRWAGNQLSYSSEIIPLISPVTTGNLVMQKADGTLEDAAIAASTVSTQGYPYASAGKIDVFDDYHSPATSFPYYWLGNADAIITTANWPDLVPALRAKYLRDGGTAQAKVWLIDAVVAGDGASAVLTYTAYATATKGPLSARTATKLLHGLTKYPYVVTPKMTITIPTGGANNVPAGTYYISAIDTTEATRTITIATTGLTPDGTAVINVGAEVYPHRVADTVAAPTTKAWMYKEGDAELIYFAGNTYNGTLLSVTVGAGLSPTNIKHSFVPYYAADGSVWCKVDGSATIGATSNPMSTATINGLTSKNLTDYRQALAGCVTGGSGLNSFFNANSSDIQLEGYGTCTQLFWSGRVECEALPDWANMDTVPWNIARKIGQEQYIWGKSYTP